MCEAERVTAPWAVRSTACLIGSTDESTSKGAAMEACKYCGQQHAYICPSIESMSIDSYGNVTWVKFRSPGDYEQMKYFLDKQSDAKKQLKSVVDRVLAES